MEMIEDGGFVSAGGFRVGSARCGLKRTPDVPDVALLVSDGPSRAAGVFTTNCFAAAPVRWCRTLLPASDVRAVAVNAGNANAATGRQGEKDVERTAEMVAGMLDCEPEQVLVASTGHIGTPLPMDRLKEGLRQAAGGLSQSAEADRSAQMAIMTTDTRPKACAVRASLQGRPFLVGGMAKGAGMISPHLATTLCFVSTDADVPAELLRKILGRTADVTFNRITVDGDTSTNDTILVLAAGTAGVEIRPGSGGSELFARALEHVLRELSLRIVRDGEGATKVLRVLVKGAKDRGEAHRVARAVAESQLVKCAVHGEDPNWGRVACAVGYSGVEVVPRRTALFVGDVCVLSRGEPTGRDAAGAMKGDRVTVTVELGRGEAEDEVWTCDLSEDYVRVNGAYEP